MNGSAENTWDDQVISDAELLYRRLPRKAWIEDKHTGMYRLASYCMVADDDGISVYGASKLAEGYIELGSVFTADKEGLASLTAGDARDEECGVVYDPNEELPINFAHMLIKEPQRKLSHRDRRDLSTRLIARLKIIHSPPLGQ